MSNARDRGLDWLRSTGTGSSLRSPVRKVKVRPDVVSRHVRARGSLDDETRALAPLLMGDADHCRHRHRGMAQRMTLDLLRADPLAARFDQVLRAVLFVEAARKAGVTACVPADEVSSLPNLIHIKTCDEERTHQAAN